MQNKKSVKTILLAVLIAAMIAAAFLMGSFVGKNQNGYISVPSEKPTPDSNQTDNSEETRISDDVFNLITAFDDYADAVVQQAEIEFELKFGSLGMDEDFSVRSGFFDDIQVNHIQYGKLDVYICDGKVFVEDDNAHFNISSSDNYESLSMRQLFAIAYEIAQNSDFEINRSDNETIYTITLTQQQIENILNSFQDTMTDYNVKIENGMLQIVLENGKLDEIDVICNGHTEILSVQIDGRVLVSVDLSVSQQSIEIPQSVIEQLK